MDYPKPADDPLIMKMLTELSTRPDVRRVCVTVEYVSEPIGNGNKTKSFSTEITNP